MRESEPARVERLRPHPQNYRSHPPEQLAHIEASLREHGVYRNVVVCRGDVILAGHGVVEAARSVGLEEIPVVRLDVDPGSPEALRVLTGDNEMMRLAEVDDRALTEMLREIRDGDEIGLLGTGFDDAMLANLLMVTRTRQEIEDESAAEHWVGMPEFTEQRLAGTQLLIQCDSDEDREKLLELLGITSVTRRESHWSAWWPPRDREDRASVRFEG